MNLFESIKKEVESGNVSEYSEFQAKLAEFKSEVPDASTKDGYARAKEVKGILTSVRTAIEAKRKEYKSPILELGRLIDSEAKRITEEVKCIETPFHEAYKAIDDEKKRIKQEIEDRIIYIKDMPSSAIESDSSEVIEAMIGELAEYDVSKETFGRRVDEASSLVAQTLERLSELHAKQVETEQERIRIEAERAELEKLRKEAEEREAAQREAELKAEREAEQARIAEEAAQRALEEERERQQAENQRIERERQEAIERENKLKLEAELAESKRKQEAEEAEKRRIADIEAAKQAEIQRQKDEEAKQKAEQEEREANRKHCAKIHGEIVEDLVAEFAAIGVGENEAKEIVSFIAKRKVRNLFINY